MPRMYLLDFGKVALTIKDPFKLNYGCYQTLQRMPNVLQWVAFVCTLPHFTPYQASFIRCRLDLGFPGAL